MDLASFLHALEVRLHVLFQTRMRPSALLDKCDAIADAEAILQEERATNALHLALHHYANAVAQHVSLVHVVCSQDDDAVFLVGLKHIPKVAPRAQVHTCGGLVKHDELRASTKSHAYGCLSLITT